MCQEINPWCYTQARTGKESDKSTLGTQDLEYGQEKRGIEIRRSSDLTICSHIEEVFV